MTSKVVFSYKDSNDSMDIIKLESENNILSFEGTANKAEKDSSGNIISSTYLKNAGARGSLSGYSAISVNTEAITISKDSADTVELGGEDSYAVSIPNSDTGISWTKVLAISNANITITFGDNWKFADGETPEISQNSVITLYWCGTFGLASLIVTE